VLTNLAGDESNDSLIALSTVSVQVDVPVALLPNLRSGRSQYRDSGNAVDMNKDFC